MRKCPSCNKSYPDKTQYCAEDGTALGPVEGAADPRVGTTVDRYRVEQKLGTGGMGVVYRAEHIHLRRPVALKLLHSRLEAEPEVVERFFREARAAADLKNPHIVEVSDFGTLDDGAAFLVMEYLQGSSLDELIRSERRLEPERAVRIACQVANALGAAHEKGVIHRDLKPPNVMLADVDGDPDFVKVLDFGIAKLLEGDTKQLTKTGIVMGTPAYMAPEQASGGAVDARTDIYALGVILYEMLTGAPPFGGDNPTQILVAHVTVEPAPLRAVRPELPEALEQVILACLAKEPDGRPATMDALRQALATWAPGNEAAASVAAAPVAGALVAAADLPQPAVPDIGTAPTVAPPGLAPTAAAPAMTGPGVSQAPPTMAATGPATPAAVQQAPVMAPTVLPETRADTPVQTVPPQAPLQHSAPQPMMAPMQMAPAQPASSRAGLMVGIIVAVLLGCILVGGGVAFFVLSTSDDVKETSIAAVPKAKAEPVKVGDDTSEYDDPNAPASDPGDQVKAAGGDAPPHEAEPPAAAPAKPAARKPVRRAVARKSSAVVIIDSVPRGADVVNNGRTVGQTPLPFTPPGTTFFVLKLKGYKAADVTVNPGDKSP